MDFCPVLVLEEKSLAQIQMQSFLPFIKFFKNLLLQGFLKENYCPTLDGEENVQMCMKNLTEFYVEMLWMIVEHFFVDGAQHICQAWGFCDVAMDTFP